MDTSTMIYVAIFLVIAIGGSYIYFYSKEKKELASPIVKPAEKETQTGSSSLKLQAYERLVILAERIALPNLIARMSQPGINKTDMQQLLTNTIKQEFDYNLSQQIYVSNEAWEAIRNLKEQNIHLVNQVAIILPAETTGLEMNKKIIEVIMSQPQGSMHTLVQEALSYEAKKIL